MKRVTRLHILILAVIVLLALTHLAYGQAEQTRRQPSPREQKQDELAAMKADVAKMQSLLNQMQAVFALVGNPTSAANHELELNMDMWRILIGQMQRRIEDMERSTPETSTPPKSAGPPRTP